MHQGQLDTLADVVHFYNTLEGASSLDHHSERVLEPLGLSVQEEADLVAFLRAVTGSTPGDVEVARPRPESPQPLPKSSEISPVGTSQPGISGP
jgi:cytochrome c peroxidase